MSRRSMKQRRSAKLKLSAMREGRGEVGSDGPLPVVGNAASPPRKSWTWASNTGLWLGLVVPMAILAVAGLAVGGAGGQGRFSDDQVFLAAVSPITLLQTLQGEEEEEEVYAKVIWWLHTC